MKLAPPSRASYFVSVGGVGRVRRPRDVAIAVFGLTLSLWAVLAANRLPGWAASVGDLVASSPQWVRALLGVGYLVSLIYALAVTAGLMMRGHDRGPALRDLLLVVTSTLGIVVLLSFLVNGAWPYLLPEIDLKDPVRQFPVTRVAVVTGILLVAAPYLTRPLRGLGWLAILTTAAASVGLGLGSPIHAIGSLGIGMMVGGLLLVVVGTPRGYPSPEAVVDGLRRLGVRTGEVRASSDQRWGLVRFEAAMDGGTPIAIKVYGRDAFDSQLAAKVWRSMMYRELGRTVSFSRLQAVEHEALVTLMARRGGVSAPDLVAVGNATAELALVAFEDRGQRIDEGDPARLDDGFLTDLWTEVRKAHDANLTHGSLGARAVRRVDGSPMLVDFGLGTLAPEVDDRAGDTVELLFSLSLLVGAERAVQSALQGLGRDALVESLPYLQVPAITAASRRQTDKPKRLVAELTEAIVDMTGVDQPQPVELRRVTLRNLVTTALLLLMASALIPLLTQVDYPAIWDVLQSADWLLLVLALVLGHAQFFPQATSTMFAVPSSLPFWPLFTLQTASQFISLAIPSSAGRVAMNAAFLRKFGLTLTQALALGAIDGFSGFLVQVGILIVVLLTGEVDLGLEIDTSDVPWLFLLGAIALVIVGVVVVVLRVARLRERIVPIVSQAWAALMGVLKQPARAIGLLGSNFVYWNVLGLTLWVILGSVGAPTGFGPALFVAAGTSLLAGLMPIPGGVGVAEATMIALLATFGVDEVTAVAVTAVYRVITFYLPALEGLFGTRWLERNGYI